MNGSSCCEGVASLGGGRSVLQKLSLGAFTAQTCKNEVQQSSKEKKTWMSSCRSANEKSEYGIYYIFQLDKVSQKQHLQSLFLTSHLIQSNLTHDRVLIMLVLGPEGIILTIKDTLVAPIGTIAYHLHKKEYISSV